MFNTQLPCHIRNEFLWSYDAFFVCNVLLRNYNMCLMNFFIVTSGMNFCELSKRLCYCKKLSFILSACFTLFFIVTSGMNICRVMMRFFVYNVLLRNYNMCLMKIIIVMTGMSFCKISKRLLSSCKKLSF